MTSAPLLDHLVFFVESLSSSTLEFLSKGFTITPGGTHGDGLTANVLLLLKNGVYIELVAFTELAKPEDKIGHWLAGDNKPCGLIDWVLGPGEKSTAQRVAAINEQAGKEVYLAPVAGGRKTAEGNMLAWETAAPVTGNSLAGGVKEIRGRQPFWCEDVSPRAWRVPAAGDHANGATNIQSLVLLSAPSAERLASYIASLSLILTPVVGEAHQFEVGTPAGPVVKLIVRQAATEEEIAYVNSRGEGLFQINMTRDVEGGELFSYGIEENGRIVVA